MEFIISDILVFTFAVFLLLVTPGPGVLSTAGVGSGFGSRAGLVYLIGLFLLLFFILVIPELTMFLPNLMSN